MDLTTLAKEKLRGDDAKMKIALKLGKSYLTMRRWLKSTPVHSNLTKIESIDAIAEVTGLPKDEIFKREN